MAGSLELYWRFRLSDNPVSFCHRNRRLVRYGALSGRAYGDSLCVWGFYLFRRCGGAGGVFQHLPDSCMLKQLYCFYICINENEKRILPSDCGRSGCHLYIPDFSDNRRRDQIYSPYGCYPALYKLWRKQCAFHLDHVLYCSGNLLYQGRGRRAWWQERNGRMTGKKPWLKIKRQKRKKRKTETGNCGS